MLSLAQVSNLSWPFKRFTVISYAVSSSRQVYIMQSHLSDKSTSAPFGLQDIVQIGQTEKIDEVDEELANIKTKSTPMAPVSISNDIFPHVYLI